MTSSHLKSLTIASFRGAAKPFQLKFEKGKRLTLIYGENGTGKTTICDGLALLDDAVSSSLDGKGLRAIEKYLPTLGATQEKIAVTLETGSGICSGKMQGQKVIVDSKGTRPRVALLRRNQMSMLIEAPAGKRYEAIQRFINIETVEVAEQELKKLIKSKNEALNWSAKVYANKEEFLEQQYEKDGRQEGLSTEQWAHGKMATPTAQIDTQIDAIGKLRQAFLNLESQSTEYKKNVAGLEAARGAMDQARIIEENAIAQADGEAGELLGLLEASVPYLHKYPTASRCPLCDSAENSDGLLKRVEEKLNKLKELSKARNALKLCKKNFEMQERTHAALMGNYYPKRTNYISTQEGYGWLQSISLPLTQPPEEMATLEDWLFQHSNLPEEWKTMEGSWQREKGLISNVTDAVNEFRKHYKDHKDLEAAIPHMVKAHAILMKERQAFTDEIIQAIAGEVGQIYEDIHPGEGLNKISLQLNPKQRASLDLSSEFYQEKAPPQAYFSQSHLDTLGLCIFLALAKRDTPQETILVLDDVVGSIDEPHVDRVIGMLYEQSKQFKHCIITTHYRPWKEKFRWGMLKNGQIQFVELTRWDLSTGLRMINTLPEIDRLRKQLAEDSPDLQIISAKAGVILEAALDYLTKKYHCSVPRRVNYDYTIGEMLDAMSGKLRKALVAEIRDTRGEDGQSEVTQVHLGEILDKISGIFQIRNARILMRLPFG